MEYVQIRKNRIGEEGMLKRKSEQEGEEVKYRDESRDRRF